MAVNSCGKLVKALLFVFNFLVFIGGIAVMAVGIYTVVATEDDKIEDILGSSVYESASYILIVTGVLIIIISFLGCCGAWREVKCMLLMYFFFLLLIFIILMVGGILGFVYKDQLETELKSKFESTIREDYGKNIKGDDISEKNKLITQGWDQLQSSLKCCAVDETTIPVNFGYWQNSKWCLSNDPATDKARPRTIPCVPRSCCGLSDVHTNPQWCSTNNVYKQGCYSKGKDILEGNALMIGGIGIGIALCLIVGMIFSILLYKQVD